MNNKIAVVKSKKFFFHKSDRPKMERPSRLDGIYEYINDNQSKFLIIEPEEIYENKIISVHSKRYVESIKNYSQNNDYFNYDQDTYINKNTYRVTKVAAGGCIELADNIMTGEATRGFALVRPPGHHAEAGRAMGFCIFNNAAITAMHLLEKWNLKRILILDFDAHHGNGTQEIFYENGEVLTLSVHQDEIFPFGGKATQIGANKGLGYNINIPVPSYFGDAEYAYIFGAIIQPVIAHFLPQIIIVSAGYDAHKDDSSNKLQITTQGFGNITDFTTFFADNYADGKLMFILEGGYNEEALTASLIETLNAMSKTIKRPPGFMFSSRANKVLEKSIPDFIKNKWGIC